MKFAGHSRRPCGMVDGVVADDRILGGAVVGIVCGLAAVERDGCM